MKRVHLIFILIVLLLGAILQAFAGKFYGKTVFMGDVTTGTWYAMSNLQASVGYSSRGTYTNGGYTNTYRMSGTNLDGRLPYSTNVSVSWTGSTNMSNQVTLSWGVYGGLAAYVVERSYDGGSTWTNWIRVTPGNTNWTDYGTNTWSTNDWTNGLTTIPIPTTPWTTPTSGPSSAEWTTHTGNSTTVHGLTGKWSQVSGLATAAVLQAGIDARTAEIQDLQGYTNGLVTAGFAVETQDGFLVIRTTDGRTMFLVGGTNYQDYTRAALSMGTSVQLYSGASGEINLYTGPAGGQERFRIASNGVIQALGNTLSNVAVKANSLSLLNGQVATNLSTSGSSSDSNAAHLASTSYVEDALKSGRAVSSYSLTRYQAGSTANKEIYVLATSTGVTATIVGTGISFTIPSGCRLISARIRWPGTDGTTLTLDMGTNDMANASLATRWGCTAAVYREDTGALISTAVPRLVTGTHDQIEITGLNASQQNHIVVGF